MGMNVLIVNYRLMEAKLLMLRGQPCLMY